MSSLELTDAEQRLIREEEEIFRDVIEAIYEARRKRQASQEHLAQRLEDLREEASKAKTADLPALFDQMNTQRALMERQPKSILPDIQSPYFAHMGLEENGKRREVLLGHLTFLESRKLPIIDWKHAPISRIFFNYREGEEYEEELPGRVAMGTVIKRRVVTIHRGQLVRIHAFGQSYRRKDDGSWVRDTAGFIPNLAGGSGTASRTLQSGLGLTNTPGPDVSALLDPEQFRILTADRDDPLLILGGAGCGKTTVALHRIAFLHHQHPDTLPQNKILVVVPEEGLVRLSRKLLDSLGLSAVEVRTFDAWVEVQARRLLRSLPGRTSDYTSSNVSRLKRHPALLKLFPEIVRRQIEEIIKQLDRHIPGSQHLHALLRDRTDLTMLDRLNQAEAQLSKEAEAHAGHTAPMQLQNIKKFFDDRRKRYMNTVGDRADLYTNLELLQLAAAHSDGQITESMIRDTISHVMEQLGQNAEQQYSGYASDVLETVDGRSLIEDEKEQSMADTIDVEDFAVLLELHHYKTGKDISRHGRLKTYAHMVIDEAQDLATVELKVLGRALEEGAAISIAGDAAQQIDPTHSFASWEHVLDELGLPRVHANHLQTTYRSPEPIAAFAHAILGPLAPAQRPKAIRDGLPVARTLFPDEGQMAVFLSDTLTNLMLNEPQASIAIITKTWDYALSLYKLLEDIPKVRLVEGGEFEFRPGIDITPASEVKGLEFDYVIVPDANIGVYLDKPEDRRLLHVAATRAIHQLWVISVGRESLILPPLDD
ncbi:AAA family ATPase [Oligoflexus tunisiensis]|uniref:AAA family ATPase n=1 Tax=Oligoflexus tunisiensis TaxID=708132 RepID=UPI00114CCCE2|nr:AAA family ATPase [Oligoflexus tunisiensis]